MSHFSGYGNLAAALSLLCSDLYHEIEDYTLITGAICFQTCSMTLCYHKKSTSKKASQTDLVLAEIWLLTVADSEHTNFICGMIGAYYLCSDIPNIF
jgi:hypothetical protein